MPRRRWVQHTLRNASCGWRIATSWPAAAAVPSRATVCSRPTDAVRSRPEHLRSKVMWSVVARAISVGLRSCWAAALGLATASPRRHCPTRTSSQCAVTTSRYDTRSWTDERSLRTTEGDRRTPIDSRRSLPSGVRPRTRRSSTGLDALAWKVTDTSRRAKYVSKALHLDPVSGRSSFVARR